MGHINDLWHRLRQLLAHAGPLVVRRRCLIEVPSPLPVEPLGVRRKISLAVASLCIAGT
jgi:hypothetical protein